MKYPSIAAAALIALLAPVAMAANNHAGHGTGSGHAAPAQADVVLSEGTVKKVDEAAGKVTIAHGPLGNLGMPSMTMVFRVKNAAWLEQMKVGDKIRFLADRVDGAFTVVRYESAD